MHRVFPLRLVLSLLMLLVLLSALQAAPPHPMMVEPFTPARNHGGPLIQIRFSNSVTGTFLVDTGSFDCFMTDKLARKAGLPVLLNGQFFSNFINDIPSSLVVVRPDIRINNLHIEAQPFQVVSASSMFAFGDQPIDGILGGTLLSHFALLIDYPRHTLVWIKPGNLDAAAVTSLGLDPRHEITLFQRTVGFDHKVNLYAAHAQLGNGGKSCTQEMEVDTGALLTSLSSETAKNLDLSADGSQTFQFIFQTPETANFAHVPLFDLAGQTLPQVGVLYPRRKDSSLIPLLGENVLSGGVVLLDFGPHRAYFKPVLPTLLAGPLPPVVSSQVDWDRLAHAPDLPTPSDLLATRLDRDDFTGSALRATHLRASLTGSTADAAIDEQLGLVSREAHDESGAAAAFAQAVALRQSAVAARPADPQARSFYISTLLLSGRDQDAEAASAETIRVLPSSALVWCLRGTALEIGAARLLVGSSLGFVVEDNNQGKNNEDSYLEPYPLGDLLPEKPTAATAQQIERLRREARESLDRAAILAPTDPHVFEARAGFWTLERGLLTANEALGEKHSDDARQTVFGGFLADCQRYARWSGSDPGALHLAIVMDTLLPQFHDWKWLIKHDPLGGAGLDEKSLMTAKSAEASLQALTKDTDKTRAATALIALGKVQTARGDEAGAESSWRQALTLNSMQPEVWRVLGNLLLSQDRENDLAEALITQLSQPNMPTEERALPLRLLLAMTLRDMNIVDESEAQVRLVLSSAPDNAAANRFLAGLLLTHGKADPNALTEAAACLTRAKNAYGAGGAGTIQTSLQTMQAVLTALNGNPTEGRQQLLDLLQAQPECTQAREALAALTLPAP